ncbi:MAG: hypothetical protein ACREOK_04395 [Gemmatimonadaceae bacterium]
MPSTPTRRARPPIDPRAWIIVPFDNVTRNAEIEWLRSGVVNLLYLGMSRWNDVRVVDDERVADLMRDLPAVNAPTIALSTGITVAKRAGAGRLVMGDVIRLGSRTVVTAKVYDVATGRRIRSVTEETTVADSVLPMFGRLAEKVLNVAAPAGVNVGSVGTHSIAAYQEYLRGVAALNNFRIGDARRALMRALELDSTFALAHYKMTVVNGWDGGAGTRAHIEAAARLSESLPERERQLITGHLWHQRGQRDNACQVFSALLASDSSDVDAWYGLGDCKYHDVNVQRVPADTSRMRFRGEFNASVHAFRRALEFEPNFHLAYQHLVDAFQWQTRFGEYCPAPGQPCTGYVGFALNAGDSLVMTPVPASDSAAVRAQFVEYARTQSRRRNSSIARRIAEEWVGSSPSENRAHIALASTYFAAGELAAAERVLASARRPDGTTSDWLAGLYRFELAVRQWRGAEANVLYDSLRAVPDAPGLLAQVAPVLGRLHEYDSLLARSGRMGPARTKRRSMVPRMILGVAGDSMAAVDSAAFAEGIAAGGPVPATLAISSSLGLDFRTPRLRWPDVDPSLERPLLAAGFAVARGHTASLPGIARQLDSLSSVFVAALMPDSGLSYIAAEAYLAAGDSAAALRLLQRMLDTAITYTWLTNREVVGQSNAVLVPRAMLTRAELAAALGQRQEAALWYDRFIALWQRPDPALMPLLDRAKRARAALGVSPRD